MQLSERVVLLCVEGGLNTDSSQPPAHAASSDALRFTVNVVCACRAQVVPREDGFPFAVAVVCARITCTRMAFMCMTFETTSMAYIVSQAVVFALCSSATFWRRHRR